MFYEYPNNVIYSLFPDLDPAQTLVLPLVAMSFQSLLITEVLQPLVFHNYDIFEVQLCYSAEVEAFIVIVILAVVLSLSLYQLS